MVLFASKKRAGVDMNTNRGNEKAVAVVEHHGVEAQHCVAFDALVDMIAPRGGGGMVAQSSARLYRDTYTRWSAWCTENAVDALDLNYANVNMYLAARETSKSSRQRELAALRKLAEVLAVVDFQNPARRAALDSLKLLRVHDDHVRAERTERSKRALSPRDAEKMLDVWRDADDVPEALAARNRAIVATLLLTALRRSELRALDWSDVDFDNGVIHVARGKGGKAREVAIFGDAALEALAAWKLHALTPDGAVFTAFRRGGKAQSARMTTTAIYNVVVESARRAGVNHVAPHDCRRTLITELLATGASLQDVQAQAGHARGSTTLLYAKPVDARQRRQAARVRYG